MDELQEAVVNDNCLVCGQESVVGCHGIRNGEVYDEYFCAEHASNKSRNVDKEEVTEEETDVENNVRRGSSSEDHSVRPSEKVSDLVEYYYKYYEARLSSQSGRHV